MDRIKLVVISCERVAFLKFVDRVWTECFLYLVKIYIYIIIKNICDIFL